MRNLFSFVRVRTEKLLDNVVAKALTNLETNAIRPALARTRRRATRDFSIGAAALLLALGMHFWTANDAVPLALVAAACGYSIVLFVLSRINDVRTYLRNRRIIHNVTAVTVPAFWRAKLGTKFHAAGEALYDAVYEGRLTFENAEGKVFQVGKAVRGAHKITAALGLVPDKGEVFEQVYAQMLALFWRLARSQIVAVVAFAAAYSALTSGIRVVVQGVVSEARLTGLFDPIVFPAVYLIGLFTR